MRCQFLIAAIGSLLFLTNCKKNNEDSPNPSSANIIYQVGISGQTSQLGRINTSDASSRIEDVSISWTGGYITTAEIKFSAKGKGDNKIEFRSKTVQHIDLFNAAATIGSIALVPGTYDKIDLRTSLEPSPPYAAFELTGFFIYNGVQVPITLRFDEPLEIKFQLKAPVNFDVNTSFLAFHDLALDLLTSGITVQMLNNAVKVNNMIIISPASNTVLFNLVWKAWQNGIVKVQVKKH